MTNYEKETIINFNEGEAVATVYAHNGAMKRKLANFAAAFPDLCKLIRTDKTGGVTYEVDKTRLSVNLTKPLTAEQIERRRENCRLNKRAQNAF